MNWSSIISTMVVAVMFTASCADTNFSGGAAVPAKKENKKPTGPLQGVDNDSGSVGGDNLGMENAGVVNTVPPTIVIESGGAAVRLMADAKQKGLITYNVMPIVAGKYYVDQPTVSKICETAYIYNNTPCPGTVGYQALPALTGYKSCHDNWSAKFIPERNDFDVRQTCYEWDEHLWGTTGGRVTCTCQVPNQPQGQPQTQPAIPSTTK